MSKFAVNKKMAGSIVLAAIALLCALVMSTFICATVRQGEFSFQGAFVETGFTKGRWDVPHSKAIDYTLEEAAEKSLSMKEMTIQGNSCTVTGKESQIVLPASDENMEIVSLTLVVDKMQPANRRVYTAVRPYDDQQGYTESSTRYVELHEGVNFIPLYEGGGAQLRVDLSDLPLTAEISKITLEEAQRIEWVSMGAVFNWLILAAVLFIGLLTALLPPVSKRLLKCFTPLYTTAQAYGEFLKKNPRLLVVTALTAITAFGYEICNFTLSIDEERVMAYGKETMGWLAEGRVGIGLFKQAFMADGMFPPFFGTFISVLLWVASALLWCQIMERLQRRSSNVFGNWIFCAIWCSLPIVIPEFIIYNTYNIEVALGMLCLTWSLGLVQVGLEKKQLSPLIWSTILFAFSLSIYQSYAAVFITGTVISLVLWLFCGEHSFQQTLLRTGVYIGAFAGGMAIYFGGFALLKKILQLPVGYTDQFSGWNGEGTFLEKLGRSLKSLQETFFTFEERGMEFFFLALMALLACILLSIIFTRGFQRIGVPILLLCLAVAPFTLWLGLLSSFLPPRTIQALPLMTAFSWYFLYFLLAKRTRTKVLSIVCGVLALVVVGYQTQTMNALFHGDHLRYEQDKQIAMRIVEDIEEEIGRTVDRPIEFIGTRNLHANRLIPPVTVRGNVMGASYWQWGEEDRIQRIAGLYHAMGYTYRFVDSTPEDVAYYTTALAVWPSENSIMEQKDKIVVRLG